MPLILQSVYEAAVTPLTYGVMNLWIREKAYMNRMHPCSVLKKPFRMLNDCGSYCGAIGSERSRRCHYEYPSKVR